MQWSTPKMENAVAIHIKSIDFQMFDAQLSLKKLSPSYLQFHWLHFIFNWIPVPGSNNICHYNSFRAPLVIYTLFRIDVHSAKGLSSLHPLFIAQRHPLLFHVFQFSTGRLLPALKTFAPHYIWSHLHLHSHSTSSLILVPFTPSLHFFYHFHCLISAFTTFSRFMEVYDTFLLSFV